VLTSVRYLISSGNASEAETRASRLHSRWESPHALGPDHEDTLRAAAACAAANRALGRHIVAQFYGTRLLARRRRLHGDDDPGTLTAAADLADIHFDAGDHEAARELDADTLKRRRRVLGKDHPDTRRSADNLARDLRALRETGWRRWCAALRRRIKAWRARQRAAPGSVTP
jgi:Tetratricopeptide repeat